MLRGLSSVRRRVEQMATETASAACSGDHQRVRIIWLEGDDPPPPWPEAEAGGTCACGEPLEYLSLENSIRRDEASDRQ